MISLIRDNYNLLQCLACFGISLGFGDKTVRDVCREYNVDTYTFLGIVNFTINGYCDNAGVEKLSVGTLLQYLKASHNWFLGFQLPFIRKSLAQALGSEDKLEQLIIRIYDEYARAITRHLKYEEKTVFPYVENLLRGDVRAGYTIDTYSKHHGQESDKLRELKSIIIKYLPCDMLHNNYLSAVLYDIYNNEEWLALHAAVEEKLFIPAIMLLERNLHNSSVSANLSRMIGAKADSDNTLGEREKDVIVSLVQGMSNKEIASHLNISVNTVITHRRNIAKKLQIHSAAGLTVYAIVHKLVDISSIEM